MKLNIKEKRKEQGLTQQQLADLSGIAKSTLELAESGNPGTTLRTLSKIANALNVKITELIIDN